MVNRLVWSFLAKKLVKKVCYGNEGLSLAWDRIKVC